MLRPQAIPLALSELEHEIAGESLGIPSHSLVESSRRYSIQRRQIAVEHHLFATDRKNPPLDPFHERRRTRLCELGHGAISLPWNRQPRANVHVFRRSRAPRLPRSEPGRWPLV